MFARMLSMVILLLLFTINSHAQTQDTVGDAEYMREWTVENTAKYKKLRHDGSLLLAGGSAAAGIGLAVACTGVVFLRQTRDYDVDSRIPAKRAGGIVMTTLGGLTLISGIGMLVSGATGLLAAKAVKARAHKRGVEISYSPYIVPVGNSYGVYMSLRF